MKRKPAATLEPVKRKFVVHKYTVIRFDEEGDGKSFECIPDLWFVNTLRSCCYFPPKTGKSYTQRAINCEKPDDSWGTYECSVVKGGFLTYNAGFKVVQEKCSQRYNTSSAEEQLQAADFRRQHPGLIGQNIEHVFAKSQTKVNLNHEKFRNLEGNVSDPSAFNTSAMINVADNNVTVDDSAKKPNGINKNSSRVKPTESTNMAETSTNGTSGIVTTNSPSSLSISLKRSKSPVSIVSRSSSSDSNRTCPRSSRSCSINRRLSGRSGSSRQSERSSQSERSRQSESSRKSTSRKPTSPQSVINTTKTTSENTKVKPTSGTSGIVTTSSPSNSYICSKRPTSNHAIVSRSGSSVSNRSCSRSQRSSRSRSGNTHHSRSPTIERSRPNVKSSHRLRDSQSHSSLRSGYSINQRLSPRSGNAHHSRSPTIKRSRPNVKSSHRLRDSRSQSSLRSGHSINQRLSPRSGNAHHSRSPPIQRSRPNVKLSHRLRDSRSHSSLRSGHSINQRLSPRSGNAHHSRSPPIQRSRPNVKLSHRLRDSRSDSILRSGHSINQRLSPLSENAHHSRSPPIQRSRPNVKLSHRLCDSRSHSSLRSGHSINQRLSPRSENAHHSRSPPMKRSRASGNRKIYGPIISGARPTLSNGSKNNFPQKLKQNTSRTTVKNSISTNEDPSRPKNDYVSTSAINHLVKSISELTGAVEKCNDRMIQNDRRLNRLEVTANKILITLGDMNGHSMHTDNDLDDDFVGPNLPIISRTELYLVDRKLNDVEFRRIWLKKERHYCCPTKNSTDTRTITKYLKRFISLSVRSKLTLKEQNGEDAYTLYRDYKQVYEFLIDIMTEGYRICGKRISKDEAHTALRVVWGRSKQLHNADKKK